MRNSKPSRWPLIGVLALAIALPVGAEEADSPRDERHVKTAQVERDEVEPGRGVVPAASPAPTTPAQLPVYKLPSVGKPRRRVGGGRRGGADAPASVTALVPDHVGLTVAGQPVLYWWLDGPAVRGAEIQIALAEVDAIDPLVERSLAGEIQPGLQRIALEELGITLTVGPDYEWSVALVLDAEHRSKDIVTAGWIRRVAEPDALPPDAASRAAHGLWYDALDAAARDPEGQAAVSALLAQVGLDPVRQ